jgi:hypothetical protein
MCHILIIKVVASSLFAPSKKSIKPLSDVYKNMRLAIYMKALLYPAPYI